MSRIENPNKSRPSSQLYRATHKHQKTPVHDRRNNRSKIQKKPSLQGAKNKLKLFKQATLLAVAFTGFLLLLLSPGEVGYSQAQTRDTVSLSSDSIPSSSGGEIKEATRNEALVTLNNLKNGFYRNLPKILVTMMTIVIGWIIARLLQFVLRKTIGHWKTAGAIEALTTISVWMLAIGMAVSILAGDIRALIGSLGLVGLALSWALQTPIESFTGWLLNSFRRYYSVGDRIQVGDVFGDVYKIDFLTTTVWEIGAPYRQGFVMAEQPTGRLVTFPNNEILSGSIVNLTGDFPYVWDEATFAIANESDITYAVEAIKKSAKEMLGDYMSGPAAEYEKILKKAGLPTVIDKSPQAYVVANESWTDVIIRYLVGTSERRKWKSELTLKVMEELSKPVYKDKIKPVYPRRQIQIIDHQGVPFADFKKS